MWARAAVRGAVAGLAGVAVMTAGSSSSSRSPARPDSYVPGRTLDRADHRPAAAGVRAATGPQPPDALGHRGGARGAARHLVGSRAARGAGVAVAHRDPARGRPDPGERHRRRVAAVDLVPPGPGGRRRRTRPSTPSPPGPSRTGSSPPPGTGGAHGACGTEVHCGPIGPARRAPAQRERLPTVGRDARGVRRPFPGRDVRRRRPSDPIDHPAVDTRRRPGAHRRCRRRPDPVGRLRGAPTPTTADEARRGRGRHRAEARARSTSRSSRPIATAQQQQAAADAAAATPPRPRPSSPRSSRSCGPSPRPATSAPRAAGSPPSSPVARPTT